MRTNLSKLAIGDHFRFANDERVFKLVDRKVGLYGYELEKGKTHRKDRGVVADEVVYLVTDK